MPVMSEISLFCRYRCVNFCRLATPLTLRSWLSYKYSTWQGPYMLLSPRSGGGRLGSRIDLSCPRHRARPQNLPTQTCLPDLLTQTSPPRPAYADPPP